jgi:hypothetical protein
VTYTEYLNQTDPKFMPHVLIEKDDIVQSYYCGENGAGDITYQIVLNFHGTQMCYYVVPNKSMNLKTYTHQMSCFWINFKLTKNENLKGR